MYRTWFPHETFLYGRYSWSLVILVTLYAFSALLEYFDRGFQSLILKAQVNLETLFTFLFFSFYHLKNQFLHIFILKESIIYVFECLLWELLANQFSQIGVIQASSGSMSHMPNIMLYLNYILPTNQCSHSSNTPKTYTSTETCVILVWLFASCLMLPVLQMQFPFVLQVQPNWEMALRISFKDQFTEKEQAPAVLWMLNYAYGILSENSLFHTVVI